MFHFDKRIWSTNFGSYSDILFRYFGKYHGEILQVNIPVSGITIYRIMRSVFWKAM